MFQFTPPCGGQLQIALLYPIPKYVSIHAPVRGATANTSSTARADQCFNSRPRAGGNTVSRNRLKIRFVSIHAPVRGATRLQIAD